MINILLVFTVNIHRNHLVPYYPKEPIIFPFIQRYIYTEEQGNNLSEKEPLSEDDNEDDQCTVTNFNKETDIPTTLDYQQETFNQYSPFPHNQKSNNSAEYQTDIHDYDNYINPRRHAHDRYNFRPQPRKDYRLFLGEKDILSLSQKSC